jgi:arsenate reductase
MKHVLLLSAGNPCRAIVAEALSNRYITIREPIEVIGAGMSNDGTINPHAMKALEEEGVDTKSLKPRKLDEVMQESFDLVITLCDHSKENCPVFPYSVPTIHMGFPVIDDDEAACKELVIKVKTKLVPLIQRELA